MIGRISGILIAKNPPQVVLDVGGLGYEIDVPMSTFYPLPSLGEKITLFTHFAVREEGHFLYGFASEDERFAFRALIKISGVGARTALSILSGLSVTELAHAITTQDAGRLIKIPGIGKKTAERLLLELKGKLTKVSVPHAVQALESHGSDILNALLALGYNDREATAALKHLPENLGVSDGIRQALKLLSKL